MLSPVILKSQNSYVESLNVQIQHLVSGRGGTQVWLKKKRLDNSLLGIPYQALPANKWGTTILTYFLPLFSWSSAAPPLLLYYNIERKSINYKISCPKCQKSKEPKNGVGRQPNSEMSCLVFIANLYAWLMVDTPYPMKAAPSSVRCHNSSCLYCHFSLGNQF